jgi:hypothetical protein
LNKVIPFSEPVFYLSPHDLAEFLGVTTRSLINWRKKGVAPEDVAEKIADVGNLFHFPLDKPRHEGLIGTAAYRALTLLRKGDPQSAGEAAFYALNGGQDFKTGRPYKLTECHRAWCELAYGIAMGRGKSEEFKQRGFRDLTLLYRKLRRMRLSGRKVANEYLWTHLFVLASNYALVNVGLRVEDSIHEKHKLRRWLANTWRETLRLANGPGFDHPYARALVAWNAAQVAALDGHTALFIESLSTLFTVYSKPPKREEILNHLLDDDVASKLMSDPRVKRFLGSDDVDSKTRSSE